MVGSKLHVFQPAGHAAGASMFSTLIRRSHLYVALFLSPWLLMYAVSTVVMNHRSLFVAKYGPGPGAFERERELTFAGAFSPDATPRDVARTLLASLDLEGAHNVARRPDGSLLIQRNDLVAPRRITFTPGDGKVVVEKLALRPNALLERYHRRRGYDTGYALDTAWAVSVDIFIAAIVLWVLSGLWMWWEMKRTRLVGLLAAIGGSAVFAAYVCAI
jgi:hypothetical protein